MKRNGFHKPNKEEMEELNRFFEISKRIQDARKEQGKPKITKTDIINARKEIVFFNAETYNKKDAKKDIATRNDPRLKYCKAAKTREQIREEDRILSKKYKTMKKQFASKKGPKTPQIKQILYK